MMIDYTFMKSSDLLGRALEFAEASTSTVEGYALLKRPAQGEVIRHIAITRGAIGTVRDFDGSGMHTLAVAALQKRLREAINALNERTNPKEPYVMR